MPAFRTEAAPISFGFLAAEDSEEAGAKNLGRWGGSGGAKPPRAEGGTGGDKVRSTSSPQVLMSGRRTAKLQTSNFSWLCTSPEITFKPEQHSKKTVRLTRRLLIWKSPLGSWQSKLLVWRCGAHGSSLDGAAGLKNMPLAYVLEVGIPELHFAGRPPYNYRKNFVARGRGGRAERAGCMRGRVIGRFVASLIRATRGVRRGRANVRRLLMFCTFPFERFDRSRGGPPRITENSSERRPVAIAASRFVCARWRCLWPQAETRKQASKHVR